MRIWENVPSQKRPLQWAKGATVVLLFILNRAHGRVVPTAALLIILASCLIHH